MQRKSLIVNLCSFAILAFAFFFLSGGVHAQDLTATIKIDQTDLGFRIPDLATILTFVIRLFFVIAGLVALLYLLLGAFEWITSGGDEEKVEGSRKKITAAIIGVVLIVAVLAIIVTLEQIVFRRRICFGISCAATIPNLVEPCEETMTPEEVQAGLKGVDCDGTAGNVGANR